MAPPSTSHAADAFARPYEPGEWTCLICQPNVHDKGGDPAWRMHYAREHLAGFYDAPKPEGFEPTMPVPKEVAA